MTFEEAREHLGGTLERLPDYVREAAREHMPRYLWIMNDPENRRRRLLYCEACDALREERKAGRGWPEDFRHGERTTCPWCREFVIPRHTSRSCGSLRDRLEMVWYEKSTADPETVVAYGAFCDRDFAYLDRGDDRPWLLEAEIEIRSFAVIGRGDGRRFAKRVTGWELAGGPHSAWVPARTKWVEVKRLGELTFGGTSAPFASMSRPGRVLLLDTLEQAIEGTALARAWDEGYLTPDYGVNDGVKPLTMIARHPCAEYLTKLGLGGYMIEWLRGELPAGAINWRGKSMSAVLGLSRQRLGELKAAGIKPRPALTAAMRMLDGDGLRLPATAVDNIVVLAERVTISRSVADAIRRALSFHRPARRRQALKYMARQAARHGDTRLNLSDFTDYWRLCQRYGESLDVDPTAFPGDIRAAEQRLLEIERRENERQHLAANKKIWEEQDAEIAKRLPMLQARYGFSFGGLTLRPALDGAEVRAEGKALHHCVGGYVDRYARGNTVICVLRRDVEPDAPWRTVEIGKDGRVLQDRGYRNDVAPYGLLDDGYRAALELFWEAWREREQGKERKSA